jgi:hypothetical protein
MSNAEVSAEYCQPAFVARNLAMSASCPDTKAYLLELEQLWLSPSSQARALELLCEDRMRQPQICDHCGGRFGSMLTHRWWGNKFCKSTCKDAYLRELALGRDKICRWYGFLRGERFQTSLPRHQTIPVRDFGD